MTSNRQHPDEPVTSGGATEDVAAILAAGLLRLSVQTTRISTQQLDNSSPIPPIRLALSSDSPLSVRPTGQQPVRGLTKEVTAT